MRELRVEDALLYLDQVKVEFGDRPHIYNEFLEIMKTFKTQQIDTPGVIRRVSNLFRGNRRLVLGFNTFLPEGYQIELPPDGEGPPVAVYRAPGSNITQVLQESSESQAHQVGRGNPPMGQQQSMPPPHAAQAPPMRHPPPAHGHPGMRGPPPPHGQAPVPPGGGQPMMPRDSQPGMQARPPQHSMDQRQQQAQQHPGGMHRPPPQQQQQQQMPPHDGKMPPGGPRPPHMLGALPPPHMNGQGGVRGGPRGQQQQQAGMGPAPPGYADSAAMSPQQAISTSPPEQQGAPQQQQPLEFDHAINYVTTIKKRFSSQPETYKKFLEILHTYQKEQRGIKEVLEEVSSLFEDHPDLLKEFTYFLPDAVQAQAKAQLEQAAKEAEARQRERTKQASMMQAPGLQQQQQQPVKAGMPRGPGRPLDYDRNAIHVPFGAMQGRTEDQETLIIRSAHYGVVSFDPVRPPRRNEMTPAQAAAKKGRPTAIPELPIQPNTTETAYFQKVRDHLERRELQSERQLGSRRHTPYVEFLKCLHLFGAGIVNRDELLQLVKTLFTFGHAPKSSSTSREMMSVAHAAQDLLREFNEVLSGRGPFAAQEAALKEKSKYGAMRVQDFDFSNSDNPTPSYFAYPSDYPKSLFLNNPGQSQTDAEVLNDAVVCVGAKMGDAPSIEDYDGVRVRHNAYEEMMFRIEDERYELDLAIERNAHALQQIEPFAEEVQVLRDREEKDGQPIGRLQYRLNRYALNSIHANAIARIYGEKGDEVLQHLSRNPLVVLPIVYQRLKQKDVEWRKLQAELNPKWAKACEDSYEGSLDVLCYFKRRGLERRAAPARLRDDCIHAGSYCRHSNRLKKDDEAAEPFQPTFGLRHDDPGAVLYQPFVKLLCRRGSASHKDAFDLVSTYIRANSQISGLDRERVGRIWAEFITPWFGYPAHWVADEVRRSFSGRLTPNIVKFAPGQRVFTLFGEGTIGSIVKEDNNGGVKYRVKLSFGTAYVGPTAILYAIPSTNAPFVRRDGIMARDESVFDTNMGSAQLDGKHQLLFGTESIYLFLRLYSFLCSVLEDTREHCATFPPPPNPALSYCSPTRDGTDGSVDFSSAIRALKLVLSKRMDPKRFEALGRKLSKEKVHQLAALPKLVERCASYLVKVAKEDDLLHLYDFCNHRAADPVVVREHCFTVAPDVSYRIQYQNSTGELYFSHLPKGEILLTAPSDDIKSFSEEEAGENLSPVEEDDDDDQIEEFDDTNGGQPALKRQRLK